MNRLYLLSLFLLVLVPNSVFGVADIENKDIIAESQDGEIVLSVEDSAITYLSEIGFDSIYGARPLKRTIQHELGNRLAHNILSGKFSSGNK